MMSITPSLRAHCVVERELRCVVIYLPSGIDVRLFEGADFRRTQLLHDGPAVDQLCEHWRTALLERGWSG